MNLVKLSLDLLGLKHRVQETTQQAHHREGAANQRAHGGDELVEPLALADDRHGHGRQVVGEARLRDLSVLVLKT